MRNDKLLEKLKKVDLNELALKEYGPLPTLEELGRGGRYAIEEEGMLYDRIRAFKAGFNKAMDMIKKDDL